MIRELLMGGKDSAKVVFTQRGQNVSRIEGFSDAVFGFALTLLVVSQQVPHSFDELIVTLRGFFAFAVCFLALASIWYRHYQFFRRYGMDDGFTIALNTVLLFVVLFFVYPLKFLADFLVGRLMGVHTALRLADGTVKPMLRLTQLHLVFTCYFAGFATVCLLFALLYAHAYRNRVLLELNAHEACETYIAIVYNVLPVVVSLGGAVLMSLSQSPYYLHATIVYIFLIGIGLPVSFKRLQKQRRSVLATPLTRLSPETESIR